MAESKIATAAQPAPDTTVEGMIGHHTEEIRLITEAIELRRETQATIDALLAEAAAAITTVLDRVRQVIAQRVITAELSDDQTAQVLRDLHADAATRRAAETVQPVEEVER